MKNPWRDISKVSPQRENGHREIANDVFREIVKADLTGAEFKICLCIIHHSWGFKKLTDVLSTHTIAKETNLSLRMVKKTLKSLKLRRLLCFEPSKQVNHGSPLNEYLFNKHWDTWLPRPVNHSSPVNQMVNRPVNHSSPTKERSKRKSITRPSPGKPLLEFFKQEYESARGKPYHVSHYPKQQGMFTGLLKSYSEEEIKSAIQIFLKDERAWLVNNGHTAWLFSNEINKYIHRQPKVEGLPVAEYEPNY